MAGRRSDNSIPELPTTEIIPPGLAPETPLVRVKELAPFLSRVEEAQDKLAKVRIQVIERVRRGVLTSETANALIQGAEMTLERAQDKFDQARMDLNASRVIPTPVMPKVKKGKEKKLPPQVGPRKVVI